jgi:hypothetical protein
LIPHIPNPGPYLVDIAQLVSHNFIRLRHHLTAVAHDAYFIIEYFHEGREVWYSRGWKTYKICQNEDPTCSNSLFPRLLDKNHHKPANYLKIPGGYLGPTNFLA